MASLYTHSDSNKRKTWLLMTGFFLFIVIVAYIFSVNFNSLEIVYFAIALSIFLNIFAYYNSHKFVLSMSAAKELDADSSLEAKEIYRLVENLCITAGLPLPKIYIINDDAPNAFATGRDAKHSVVALTTGLIAKLDRTELEGVIAHELSHIGNRDILLATIVTVMVGMVVMLADLFRRWSIFGGRDGNREGAEESKGKLAFTILAIVFSILAPIFAYLMQFAISRKREFAADADGALLTRNPEGLARALEKISSHPSPMKKVNQATAHLFIASPLKEDTAKKGFLAKAFMTHPPVEERVNKLRGLA
ncbi:MAG: M48 family metallopeptidase [Bacteroidales bacterium]|nr:M48 family metallopeptidase [Bacteroidales bacterium]